MNEVAVLYLLDTVALVRHFSGSGTLGKKASGILNAIDQSEDVLAISVVSLMEVLYLAEKKRIGITLADTLQKISLASNYIVVDLTPEILQVAAGVKFYELHDRLILATAKWLDVPIISSDQLFEQVEGIKIVWD